MRTLLLAFVLGAAIGAAGVVLAQDVLPPNYAVGPKDPGDGHAPGMKATELGPKVRTFHITFQKGDRRRSGEISGVLSMSVHALASLYRLTSIIEKALDRLVDVEAFGNPAELLAVFAQFANFDAGLAATGLLRFGAGRGLEARPSAVEPIRLVGPVGLAGFIFGVEARAPVGLQFVHFALREEAFADQFFRIDVER